MDQPDRNDDTMLALAMTIPQHFTIMPYNTLQYYNRSFQITDPSLEVDKFSIKG